jgi:hypothetical protein
MLKARIHNLITGERYEFTASDLAEIRERMERKANVYGRTAWIETIPAWIDTATDPPTEHAEQVIEHPAEHAFEIVDLAPEIEAARVASLWKQADNIAAQFDGNSRDRAIAWLIDPACPAWRRERIGAILAWMDSVWQAYYAAKADAAVNALPFSTPPFTFAQLVAE